MKKTNKILALCALAALPFGVVTAADHTSSSSATTEVKADKAATKTIKLKVTGMT